jgi:hypothetical protein
MKTLLILATLSGLAFAADPKPQTETETLSVKLKASEQEARLAKLEGLVLREQLFAQQLEKLRADQRALYGETCKAAGLEPDPKLCEINLEARTVTKRAPAK